MIMPKFRTALLVSSLCLFQPVIAQNLPGVEIETPTVPGSVQTLFNLAASAYPDMFVSGSNFRSYQGFTFKYYASSGIYVGVKDGVVYLLGGRFGSQPKPQGSIADVSAALQRFVANPPVTNPGTTTADFGGFIAARTLADLVSRFSSLTMEYGSSFGTIATTAQIKLEVLGQENVGGIAADTLRVTITAAGGSSIAYDMAVDSGGNVQRLNMGSFQYTAAQAQAVGSGLVSGFLIALVAGDNAQIKAALNAEIQNPALSTKITQRIVGNTSVPTVQVSVAANGASITGYISDFGSFTMMTEYSSAISNMTSGFEIIDMQLR
ncbi:MAG TPA: hypothetical protein VGE69_05845 [Pseudomonadales bacterium]